MFKSKSLLHVSLLVVIASLLLNLSSAEAAGSLGTAFTYQGVLKDGSGTPITNTCDFHFSLYPAASGGSLVAGTSLQSLPNVVVNNGAFTVSLDFGPSAFDGNARWLEIGVRCPAGSGSDVPLAPRQPLSATPYALYSVKAGTAQNFSAPLAGDVTGNQGSTTVNKLQGQPLSAGTPSDGQVLTFSGGNWAPVTPATHYANLLVVAKSGGDFTTITAALNSISDAGASNPYLIYVAPGIYTEQVTMKPYVDIQGAGELATRISAAGSSDQNTGTVIGADNAELRFLSVENTGGNAYAVAIYNSASSPRLTHVTASASGGASSNFTVVNDHSSPVMTDVAVTASGGPGSFNIGVYNNSSSPTLTNVTSSASGGLYNQGVHNYNSEARMSNVSASATGSLGSTNVGVYNQAFSAPTMTNVTATAAAGSYAYGVLNDNSSPTIQNSLITASGGYYSNDGIHNTSSEVVAGQSYFVTINTSRIIGLSSTIWTEAAAYTISVGASQFVGTGGNGIGTYVCVFSYKSDFTPLSSTCQ